jgi:tRNA pseudouridine38-40 synthase
VARSTPTRILKLTLAYDGTRFVGWQRQAAGESIQGLLETVLARIEGGPVTVHGAGRTDAGVHALGQVASVSVTCAHDVATLARAMNAELPEDIRVVDLTEAATGFHARFSARSKTYRYRIRNTPVADPFDRAYVWHLPAPLDADAMRQAASMVAGTHDFAAFQSTGGAPSSTVRTMHRSELTLSGSVLTYEVAGDGFLRHMVRAMVGTLVEVGRGRRAASTMLDVIASGRRADAGITAPARGLFLVRVDYDS